MSLFRAIHNKNYSVINNTIARDKRISWKAKGIWFYAFSRPDDWTFYLADIVNQSNDGEKSVKAGLKELEEFGYLRRSQSKEENGKFAKVEWNFYETPEEFKKCLPQAYFGPAENRPAEKAPLLSTESISKDIDILSTEKGKEAAPTSELALGLSFYLLKKIKEIHPKQKDPKPNEWAKQIDLMLNVDKRTEEEIRKAIDWALESSFWRGNIRSTKKLREHFDTLWIQMKSSSKVNPKDQAKMAEQAIDNYTSEYFDLAIGLSGLDFIAKNPHVPSETARFGERFIEEVNHYLKKKGFKKKQKSG